MEIIAYISKVDFQTEVSLTIVLRRHRTRIHIRLLIKTIARQVLRINSCIYESARNLYRGRRAVSLQAFTTRHSNDELLVVMALRKSDQSPDVRVVSNVYYLSLVFCVDLFLYIII